MEEQCEEVAGGVPEPSSGHMWTASAADLMKVLDIYSGCFGQLCCSGGKGVTLRCC